MKPSARQLYHTVAGRFSDGECCHMASGIGSGDNRGMTIATPERYAQMLDAARRGGYAYPAINVTSTQTLNAALQPIH